VNAAGKQADRPRRTPSLVWIAVVAPPTAWFAQLLLGYGVTESACGAGGSGQLGGVTPRAWTLTTTGTALVICALAGAAALAANRRRTAGANGRIGFMVDVGIAVAVVFAAIVAFTAVGLVALDPCRAA
jgi:hypothetical protein